MSGRDPLDKMGVPPAPIDRTGVPPPPRRGNDAGGKPLAVMQENFLVEKPANVIALKSNGIPDKWFSRVQKC